MTQLEKLKHSLKEIDRMLILSETDKSIDVKDLKPERANCLLAIDEAILNEAIERYSETLKKLN